MTGIGAIVVRCPRVRDRGAKVPSASALRRRFCLPTCAGRRVWRCWIPILYLKGTSTGDFADALIALLGTPAGSRPRPLDTSRRTGGRSTRAGASAISRPNATITSGSTALTCRPVSKTPRKPHPRAGRSFVGLSDGIRENAILAGTAPRSEAAREIWMAETKTDALAAFDAFVETWSVKYDKAVECLIKDRDALLGFYDFLAEHWTNVIESAFATVRHRTVRSKGCLSNKTALAMIFKLAEAAEKSWRRLNGHNQLPKVILGVKFADGIEVVRSQVQAAAA